jgi:hypothetical protein
MQRYHGTSILSPNLAAAPNTTKTSKTSPGKSLRNAPTSPVTLIKGSIIGLGTHDDKHNTIAL